MRIDCLHLKNIGPFNDVSLDFDPNFHTSYFDKSSKKLNYEEGEIGKSKISIITGENGTGKTIILDAIRGILLGTSDKIERNIIQDENNFSIQACLNIPQYKNGHSIFQPAITIQSNKFLSNNFITNYHQINKRFSQQKNDFAPWIVNYWTSKLATDSFELKNLVAPKPEDYLFNSLNGIQPNIEVTQLICFFDYLKSSDNNKEKVLGEFLFNLLKKIIKISLLDGEFRYVERQTLTPMIYQTGQVVSLDKLSSGNLYLIQRLVSLLGQMYSVHILNETSIENLCNTPGLLLIDEAENHLHPKWQKTFLNSILEIFPNLQIIVTTHSPFIVSSVKNAKVFVCKSMGDHSIVVDETKAYSNQTIEEILLSPVFNTSGFNKEISDLIDQRKQAIQKQNQDEIEKIETKLKLLNPEYFSYFDVEEMLEEISK